MSAIFGEKRTFGQRSGPDVDLMVSGDEFYARYETPEGYSALYDEERGLFCYALLKDGAFVSSGVSLGEPPPSGALLHGEESAAVRQAKSAAAQARRFPSQKQK